VQTLLQVVNIKVLFAIEHYKVVAVTLMIAEKEILAML
jgi:hypothetical protein